MIANLIVLALKIELLNHTIECPTNAKICSNTYTVSHDSCMNAIKIQIIFSDGCSKAIWLHCNVFNFEIMVFLFFSSNKS